MVMKCLIEENEAQKKIMSTGFSFINHRSHFTAQCNNIRTKVVKKYCTDVLHVYAFMMHWRVFETETFVVQCVFNRNQISFQANVKEGKKKGSGGASGSKSGSKDGKGGPGGGGGGAVGPDGLSFGGSSSSSSKKSDSANTSRASTPVSEPPPMPSSGGGGTAQVKC